MFILSLRLLGFYTQRHRLNKLSACSCYAIASKYIEGDFEDRLEWQEAAGISSIDVLLTTRKVLLASTNLLHCSVLVNCAHSQRRVFILRHMYDPGVAAPETLDLSENWPVPETLKMADTCIQNVKIQWDC